MALGRSTIGAALLVLGTARATHAIPPAQPDASPTQVDAGGTSGPRVVEQPGRSSREWPVRDRSPDLHDPANPDSPRPNAERPASDGQPAGSASPRPADPKGQRPRSASSSRSGAVTGGEPSRPRTQSVAKLAKQHFATALSAYRHGDYQTALDELHRAASLDPGSKDLEYNLALVHEKVGEPYASIEHWRQYRKLETNPGERRRADLAIRRLRAAHARQLHMLQPYAPRGRGWQGSRTDSQVAEQPVSRLDDWALGLSVTSAALFCLGIALGVIALKADPNRDSKIGDETYAELENRADRAHAYAMAADLAISVGVGSGVAAGVFWFANDDKGSGASGPQGVQAASHGPGLRLGGSF